MLRMRACPLTPPKLTAATFDGPVGKGMCSEAWQRTLWKKRANFPEVMSARTHTHTHAHAQRYAVLHTAL